MGDHSKIEWCDATWNPLRGCTEVSRGCAHCYAAAVAARFSGPGQPYEGLAYFDANGRAHWTGRVREVPEKLADPLRWRKPRHVFVNSMSDLFHEAVPDEFIDKVFAVMALAPRHTFQVLTKRAGRMCAYLEQVSDERDMQRWANAAAELPGVACPDDYFEGLDWPLPNAWLGVSCEDQATADARIPHLLRADAAVRFLSCEPLLRPIDLRPYLGHGNLHWVIVGGESGPEARPMHPNWARSIRDQCVAAGVPYFFKQWGGWAPLPEPFRYTPAFGSGSREYVAALRAYGRRHGASAVIDDRPEGWDAAVVRDGCAIDDGEAAIGHVGKKAAGRLLDGRTWDESPAPPTPSTEGR